MDLLTIKALEYSESRSYEDRFFEVLEFISNNIMDVRLQDPANTNNVVSESIGYLTKWNIKNQASTSLNEEYIKNIVW